MILISIGSNLPAPNVTSPLQTCLAAVEQLRALPSLVLRAVSRWYVTDPVPPSDQPLYVNATCRLEVELGAAEPDPGTLLSRLQAIESAAGRVRSERNAARTLDLDLIAMGERGQLVRSAPDPILPHPRAHLRAFVLVPLLDVAADWSHPVLHRTARELLADLP